MKTTYKRLGWSLLALALLAGCNGKDNQPHVAVTTYVKADWKALPSVSDADLQAGFASWRSACTRLKNDATWANTCAAASTVQPRGLRTALGAKQCRRLDHRLLRAGLPRQPDPHGQGHGAGLRPTRRSDHRPTGKHLPRTQGQSRTDRHPGRQGAGAGLADRPDGLAVPADPGLGSNSPG